LCWGLLTGLVVCVPAGYYYRFSRESRPLRGNRDYARASLAAINSDWDLFRRIQRQNAFLGDLSPARGLAPALRSSLMQAADEVIERYRNNSDPAIQDFDWPKAVVCLQHALEMDPNDSAARGKLAVANGYIDLMRADPARPEVADASAAAAQRSFQEALLLIPRAVDPHLGLARIYVYSLKNIGKAMAELHEAQRLGFQPGPREIEQEADGYRFRAAAELSEARKFRATSKTLEERYLRLAERDFERARQLYEPIVGFSNVSLALRQVDDDDRTRRELNDSLNKPVKRQRKTNGRASRWQ